MPSSTEQLLPVAVREERPSLRRMVLAEALGTLLMILFGQGVCAQTAFSKVPDCAQSSAGSYLAINLAWGLAVFVGILAAGGVSGGHLNPAVTLALALHGRVPWASVLPYIGAQMGGTFVASAIILGEYSGALHDYGDRCCAGDTYALSCGAASVWTTFPQPFETTAAGLYDQVLGTALLLAGVFAVNDQRHRDEGSIPKAAAVGAIVVAIGMCFGYNAGYAINPARDLAPRVFVQLAGFRDVFTAAGSGGGAWWWVPVVGPLLGGVLGSCVHQLCIAGRWRPAGCVRQSEDKHRAVN